MTALNPAEFLRGFAYVFKGASLLRRYPGLARYWAVPIVLTLLALVTSLVLSVRYHDDLLALLWSEPHARDALSGLLVGVYWIARTLALLATLALATWVCVLFSTLVAAPFNDALSEAIEARESGRAPLAFSFARLWRDARRTVALEGLKVGGLASVALPLWLTSWLVPGPGQVAYTVVGGFIGCAYLSLDYIDWPASRRGLTIPQRVALFRRHPLRMLGFGAGVWLCLFIPLVNLAFMPIAVAGGTRLFLDLEAETQR